MNRSLLPLLTVFPLLPTCAFAEVISYTVDDNQSELVFTVFGNDFSGAVHGTFLLASEGLADGDLAVMLDIDATVDNINLGLATLRNMTLQSFANEEAIGRIEDPVNGDDMVNLFQSVPVTLHAVYDPIFGSDEIIDETVVICLGDATFCEGESGEATIQTVTLDFSALANSVIPADANPLGEDIPVRLVLVADGVSGGPAAAPQGDRVPGGLAVHPNPSSGAVHLSIPGWDRADVFITDAAGRNVMSWQGAWSAPSVWDGNDRTGKRVAPGVYFVSAASAGEMRTAKLLRIE